MNSSEDNKNASAIAQRLMAWLIQSASSPPPPTPEQPMEPESLNADPLEGEDWGEDWDNQPLAGPASIQTGELPIVQNRFQAILKRRLKVEIERRPPLFPWETEILDYEPDGTDGLGALQVPAFTFWLPQLAQLNLPVQLPDVVLAQLFAGCVEAMRVPVQQGAKMVKAVQTLFPDRTPLLNQLAGMVLMQPARSAQATPVIHHPYEAATPEQQMALSLLAAKELLNALTVTVSADQPLLERQWETTQGLVSLTVEYLPRPGTGTLRIKGRLPKAGGLTLKTEQGENSAQRAYPGEVCVELIDCVPDQMYPLEVCFQEFSQQPLVLGILVQR